VSARRLLKKGEEKPLLFFKDQLLEGGGGGFKKMWSRKDQGRENTRLQRSQRKKKEKPIGLYSNTEKKYVLRESRNLFGGKERVSHKRIQKERVLNTREGGKCFQLTRVL